MSQQTISLEVGKDHSVPITPPVGGGTALIKNVSGDTLNYADNYQISIDTGTIAAGANQTFTSQVYIRSQGLSTVQVTLTTPAANALITGNPADDVFSLSAGTGIKLDTPVLTGSVGDDAQAISAGTGQKLTLTGGSPAASLAASVFQNILTFGPGGVNAPDGSYTLLNSTTKKIGDGSGTLLSAVYSTLAAAQAVYSFATALTQTVDFCAFQGALNALSALTNPTSATLYLPRGNYQMGSSLISVPSPGSNAAMTIMGNNVGVSEGAYGGSTRVIWGTDVTGAPHFKFAIDATPVPRFAIKNITLVGPVGGSLAGGQLPCVMAGIRLQASSQVENVSLTNFSTAIGYGGGTTAGFANTCGFDHTTIKGLRIDSTGYGINLLPGSTSAGDQHFYQIRAICGCAGIAIATTASGGFVGSSITGAGFYSVVGMYIYDDGLGTGAAITSNTFTLCSFEQSYTAAVLSQRQANPGAGIFNRNKMDYFFQAPNQTVNGWGGDVTVTGVPAGPTGNQITFNDATGIYWQIGMTVTNNANVPANTTVTALSVAWPNTPITATLSNNLTGDPTGQTVKIRQPQVATITMFSIFDNVSNIFSGGSVFPSYHVPSGGSIHDNVCFTTQQVVNGAKSVPLTSGPTYNTTWGVPKGTYLGSGQLAGGVSCSAGDLLMYDNSGQKLKLCDGTSFPVGAAVLATATAGNVDFYITAQNPNFATVINKTAGTIAANALLKVDTANPGGVTTATSLTDGYVVGVNNGTAITAGTSGTIAQLKC